MVIAAQALASVANVNLLIGTPAYAGQVHVDYVSALLVFQRQAIPFTLMTIGNESLITRARNTIISAFHERREFTHLLFLDGDVHLPYEGLLRMLGSRQGCHRGAGRAQGPRPRRWAAVQCGQGARRGRPAA